MEGSDLSRPAGRNGSHDTGRYAAARPNDGAAAGSASGIAGIALAALEAELAYRGPERRSGPGAGLAKLLASVLDEVDYGLVLIAADGHVVHANHAARVELAGAKSLQLVGRRLSGRSASDQRALDEALASARDEGKRRMLAFAPANAMSEGKSCDLSIVPLPAPLSSNHPGHAVLISLPRSRIAETLSVDAYARELGLSRREQQVLAGLCEGLRVKEIAAKLEIGDETVRSHVKRLKAKTGCAGIVDIVNQVSRLPPMVGALRQTPELPPIDDRS
ncbi:MAG TPA: helix-turn-helix transcriptional regulator [Burkholderiaceae bacterium]|nr:helix-turn-helix transcriptional regulator [Burkholderiaceae bacterium]